MKRPQPEEYNSFYQRYIDTVGDDVLSEASAQLKSFPQYLRAISPEKIDFAYAKGKWTIKELLGHVTDTERIMAYRLLRFARNDSTGLAGFDENDYVMNAHFGDRDFNDMIEEFEAVRNANLFLFRSLTEEDLKRKGEANNSSISVRALFFIIVGHVKHHQKVIEERYF